MQVEEYGEIEEELGANDYDEKYETITKYNYDTIADLHYDVNTCITAARRAEWYQQ